MQIEGDDITLSTGKYFYANNGIIGIVKNEYGISISGGYDQGIESAQYKDLFTLEERKEIAAYMINLWKEWGD